MKLELPICPYCEETSGIYYLRGKKLCRECLFEYATIICGIMLNPEKDEEDSSETPNMKEINQNE